ncbi:SCO2524 family protein [Nocardia vaccinii]|uniref:SCO2524 family protein n=1 Tax=Nocardia vaccinii TaxID=1822 RepID=UPI00082E0A20|nr:SCO2524 family protein [Nocardia vaccinii]
MRIQPRRQILNVWSSLLASCYQDGVWIWGGKAGSNSISDAEQLLCILYPATQIESFALHDPDRMADDVREALSPLGRRIGMRIVDVLDDYLQRYERDGRPIFSADSYLRYIAGAEPSESQRALDVVDSYSRSLTLCLAGLQFLGSLRGVGIRRAERLEETVESVQARLNRRLTAAMVGLVRSFVVRSVDPATAEGRAMLSMFNQTDSEPEAVVAGVARRLERVRKRLRRDVTLTKTPDSDLEDEGLLFECGWSWGVVRDARQIDFVDIPLSSSKGHAVGRPYLYFTIVALDGINDLTQPRTRELDLLDFEQRRLADALQLRWDLAQRYWSTMARYGSGRWPLEDIPWRTADGEESDYFSLCVSALLIQDLVARVASDDDLTRATPIFDELARRGRVTSRLTVNDPARGLHVPGVAVPLEGSEVVDDGPKLFWIVSDYAPMLLKRTLQAAQLSGTLTTRDQLLELAQATMSHLERRAFRTGPSKGLWDDADRYLAAESAGSESVGYSSVETDAPSWYFTDRIIECLVAAERAYRDPPLRSPTSASRSLDLLNEADHLLNQRFLELSGKDHTPNRWTLEKIEKKLLRARALVDERPGTAHSLCADALRELDELDFATRDATRGE